MKLDSSSQSEVLCASFNQDFTCISVGTVNGFKLYNCDPFGRCFKKEMGGIGIAEMLFHSFLVFLVGGGPQPTISPRALHILNIDRDSKASEFNFGSAVLAVKVNRQRIVVLTEDKITIYDVSIMKPMAVLQTARNPKGIISLSPNSDNNYLAYLCSSKYGHVMLYDCFALTGFKLIYAHKTPVSQLSFDRKGTRLATASSKGTVIRVYSVPEGELLHQFRRGSYPAQVCSIAFNINSKLLAVCSDSNTVHIFELVERKTSSQNLDSGRQKNPLSAWMPQVINDAWDAERDYACLKVPASMGQVCLVGFESTSPSLMVLTRDGHFLSYAFSGKGGGCELLSRHSFLDTSDEAIVTVPYHTPDPSR